jgi:hypothetical protein
MIVLAAPACFSLYHSKEARSITKPGNLFPLDRFALAAQNDKSDGRFVFHFL